MLSRVLLDQPLLLHIAIAFGIYAIWALYERSSGCKDSNEPVLLHAKIPVVGHIISLFLHGSDYYESIRTKTSLSIYTLSIFGHNIYVVNSPELVAAVDRNAQVFSFAPYLVHFAARALHPSKDAIEKLSENIDGGNEDPGLRIQTQKAMHDSMVAGSSTLSTMNRELLHHLSQIMDAQKNMQGGQTMLFTWIRSVVTDASTSAIYGRFNPFLRREVADGIWAFDRDLASLAIGWRPKIIAPKGYYGRKAVIDAFIEYFENKRHEEGSPLVKARYKANTAYNVTMDDLARFESSLCIALLVNTAPATFWTLYHVLSNAELLLDLRQQLEAFVYPHPQDGAQYHQAVSIEMAQVLKECPLLNSILEEVLRIRSSNASGRMVMRDTMLNDQYFLKAKSTVLIPSTSVHNNASIWGPSVKSFDPYRFVKQEDAQMPRQPAYAYRAFGGGAALCPGRYLASMEILSVLTIIVLRFDITPVDSRGVATPWWEPKSRPHILTSILSPAKDIPVLITEREKYRDCTWHFTLDNEEMI